MIKLETLDNTSIYLQIVNKFRDLIVLGVLSPNDPLPSVRSLSLELQINPNTIQRAYKELENEGLIYSRLGKGSYVMPSLDKIINSEKIKLIESIKKTVESAEKINVDIDEYIKLLKEVYDVKNK